MEETKEARRHKEDEELKNPQREAMLGAQLKWLANP